jgi:hypothetical protein
LGPPQSRIDRANLPRRVASVRFAFKAAQVAQRCHGQRSRPSPRPRPPSNGGGTRILEGDAVGQWDRAPQGPNPIGSTGCPRWRRRRGSEGGIR